MSLFELSGLVFFLVALFGYTNHRFLKLPDTLGSMVVGLLASLAMLALSSRNTAAQDAARRLLSAVNFSDLMFHGMLGMLLFAGALQVNVVRLHSQKLTIVVLASVGVILSTVFVGYLFHFVLGWLGQDIRLVNCLMFGALISPTDPIAVIGILKKAGAPVNLATKITGESLFNDGTAVVAFLMLLALSLGSTQPSVASVGLMFLKEVGGGLALGLVLGFGAIFLLKGIESHPVEILTTLSVATGGYALAERLHVCAPLTIVVAGLIIGETGARIAMSAKTRAHLFAFWELVDELINLVLFGLIGLQMLVLSFEADSVTAGLVAIPLVLAARWLSVALPLQLAPFLKNPTTPTLLILTWGGLRGGISVALALSLPPFPGQPTLVMATYCVVVFSLLVQGTTLGPLVRKLGLSAPPAKPEPGPPNGHGEGQQPPTK